MAAYCQVYGVIHFVTCELTACAPGSAAGQTLGNEYGKTLPLPFIPSGVTMGWLLRLVTGAPLVVEGSDSFILFLIRGEEP